MKQINNVAFNVDKQPSVKVYDLSINVHTNISCCEGSLPQLIQQPEPSSSDCGQPVLNTYDRMNF